MLVIYLALLAFAGQQAGTSPTTTTTAPTTAKAPAPTGIVSSAARSPEVLAGPSRSSQLNPINKDQSFINLANSIDTSPVAGRGVAGPSVQVAGFVRDAAADARTIQLRPQDNLPQTDPDAQLAALRLLAQTPKTGSR